ncbi:progranulin-like [Engraulis encrasicolus]|uniref:progranulin-like n=1 Tax=Engraulis encrasicolus TaxID=184585 RepID=UPI002FD19181
MLVHAVLASFCVCLVSASVLCPDGNTCPDKNTCCLTNSGYYGCCPHPLAVCCPDKLHCCPNGYHCYTTKCVKQGLPWLRLQRSKNTPAKKETFQTGTPLQLSPPKPDNSIAVRELSAILEKPSGVGVADVRCDSSHTCPDGSTCCKSVYTGAWYCCPYTSGQCCKDGIHCCPHGTYCDLKTFRCLGGNDSIPASPQIPALRTDYQSPLDDESKTSQTGTPLQPDNSIALRESSAILEKPSGVGVGVGVADVRCDSSHTCPDGSTCCKSVYTGAWYCCPYTSGQCCKDGIHCCPHGTYCDLKTFRCLGGNDSIPASPQIPALRTDYQDPCCLNGNEAGCCQVGFHCDTERRVCVDDLAPLDIHTTLEGQEQGRELEALGGGRVALRGIIRCDGGLYCPADHSCCRTPTGEWGCCP